MSDQSKYAVTAWGQLEYVDLTLPSGQLCQVRPAGVQAMIGAGVIESADTLTSLVSEKHIKRVAGRGKSNAGKPTAPPKPDEIDTQSLMKDPKNLQKVFKVVDRISAFMVVQPDLQIPVRMEPDPKNPGETLEFALTHEERKPGVVYTDVVDLMDKMFIFQYAVGGSTDVEAFREQFSAGLGGVAAK